MGQAVLIGAGIGAAGSALTGRDPIKGAAIGASLGAGYGGTASAMKGGSFMEGAFPFMGETTKASSLKTIAQGGGSTMPSFAPEIGMANTFNTGANIVGNAAPTVSGLGSLAPNMGLVNKIGGSAITNPANLSSVTSNFSPAIMSAANQGGLNAAATSVPMLQQLGYTADEIKNLLPDLSTQNVGNIIGGANVARQYMQRPPLQQAPSGGIKQGNPPAVTPINELIGLSRPQPKKRISLLVG
jgi:hypothetical protein